MLSNSWNSQTNACYAFKRICLRANDSAMAWATIRPRQQTWENSRNSNRIRHSSLCAQNSAMPGCRECPHSHNRQYIVGEETWCRHCKCMREFYIWVSVHHKSIIYKVSQEECARLREDVPYVKVYRYNLKHLCPKLNGYGDNGQRSLKLWQLLHTYWLPNTY